MKEEVTIPTIENVTVLCNRSDGTVEKIEFPSGSSDVLFDVEYEESPISYLTSEFQVRAPKIEKVIITVDSPRQNRDGVVFEYKCS